MNATAKKTVKTKVEVTVDPDWIEFVTGGPEGFVDVFFRNGYCGYWLEGVEHDPKLGWLAYEHAAEDRHSTDEEKNEALAAWRKGKPLPKNFHALNVEAATKSWIAGVKRKGVGFYEDGDGEDYEVALQEALLGEVVYG
jgi:hypothetical protein